MRIKFSLLLAVGLLVGCQATGPVKYQGSGAESAGCDYGSIEGDEYTLTDSTKPYVTNIFFYDSTKEKVWQLDKGMYTDLVSGNFKVVEVGVVTQEDINAKKPFLSKYRYFQEEYNGELLKRDKSFSTKVVTQNCSVYYLHGGTGKKSLTSSIAKSTGESLSDKDVMKVFGKTVFVELDLAASIKYDKFDKRYKVTTPTHNKMLLRGSINEDTHGVSYIQLYADLTFLEKWGFVKHATDTDGVNHEVTKISTDTDCSSRVLGCVLTETIGVSLSRDFLEQKKEGFEIKVYGTKEAILKVPGKLVESFLEGLDQAVSKSKSGDKSV